MNKENKQEEVVVCSICGSEYDEEFVNGYIGLIEVNFCVWCYSGLIDMAEQMNPCDCREE